MRLDLDEIARDVERRKAARRKAEGVLAGDPADRRASRIRELEFRVSILYAPMLEGRLLAAMICDPAVLAICELVEVDDFADLRYQPIIAALRNLQARHAWAFDEMAKPGQSRFAWLVMALGDELARMDARDDKHLRDSIDDLCLAELLGRHLWESYGPLGAPHVEWVLHDAAKLRELAVRRRAS